MPALDRSHASAPQRGPEPDGGAIQAPTRVLRQFRLVFNAIKSHFREVEKQAGIGGAQLWALSVVQARPRIGVRALAAAMDIHQATASNLVKSLAALDMLAVERTGPDRRTVQLAILPAGEAVLGRAPGPFVGVLPEALARLDAATLCRLEQDLSALLAVLETDERAAGIPLAQL